MALGGSGPCGFRAPPDGGTRDVRSQLPGPERGATLRAVNEPERVDSPRGGLPTSLWSKGVVVASRARGSVGRVISLAWVPLAASLVSLVLSIGAFIASTQQPEVMLILPDQIRVAQGRGSGSAFVYLQPAFVSTGQSERVEVIRGMSLTVQPPAGEAATFAWDEQVQLAEERGERRLSYRYVADAVPILVGPRSASAPLCLFDAPDGWFFAPGTYTFTLTAHRVVASEPVRATFSITLTAENVAFFDAPGPDQFLAFPLR